MFMGQLIGNDPTAASATIPSATATPIASYRDGSNNRQYSSGMHVSVSGTTTITSFGSARAGIVRLVNFTGALQLTHNASSLVLPGGGNITTAAGDFAIAVSQGDGNWIVPFYQRASGGMISPHVDAAIAAVTAGNVNGEISGLTFSATPTQAECEALRDKCEELADDTRNAIAALNAVIAAVVAKNVGAAS